MSAGPHHLTLTGDAAAVATASTWVRTLGIAAQLPSGRRLPARPVRERADRQHRGPWLCGRGRARYRSARERAPEGGSIRVEIADAGQAFDPLAVPSPPAPVRSRGRAHRRARHPPGAHLRGRVRCERRRGRNVFSFLVRRSPAVADTTAGGTVDRGSDRRRGSLRPRFSGGALERHGCCPGRARRRDRRLLGFISTCDYLQQRPVRTDRNVGGALPGSLVPAGHLLPAPGGAQPPRRPGRGGPAARASRHARFSDFTEIKAGECAGEMSVIDGKPVRRTSVAARLPADPDRPGDFISRILPIPEVARNLVTTLADRMRHSNDKMIERLKSSIELAGAAERARTSRTRCRPAWSPSA